MQTETVERICLSNEVLKPDFAGCWAADQLPEPNEYPFAVVVNVDTSIKKGSHWTCIYSPQPELVYFFCSLGRRPKGIVKRYLQSNFDQIWRNKCVFQKRCSNVCGHYAIYALFYLCKGTKFERVLGRLHRSQNADQLVHKFIQKIERQSKTIR